MFTVLHGVGRRRARVPAALSAQAFGLNEIGSCAIARGFATTGGAVQGRIDDLLESRGRHVDGTDGRDGRRGIHRPQGDVSSRTRPGESGIRMRPPRTSARVRQLSQSGKPGRLRSRLLRAVRAHVAVADGFSWSVRRAKSNASDVLHSAEYRVAAQLEVVDRRRPDLRAFVGRVDSGGSICRRCPQAPALRRSASSVSPPGRNSRPRGSRAPRRRSARRSAYGVRSTIPGAWASARCRR